MQKRIPDNLTPQQSWERLFSAERLPSEVIAVERTLDHVMAENFTAAYDVPSGPRSFMDGFAVRAEDVAKIPATLKVTGEVLMGEMPNLRLEPGQAARIPTGGFLPKGSDAVVMQEDSEISGTEVVIRRTVARDENVQVTGEDFKKGQTIFPAGHRLRAQDLAVIATFGITQVKVYKRPRLCIFSTGNELIPFAENSTDPAKIRETNSLALSNAARKFGFATQSLSILPDEFGAQRRAMEKALVNSDVVLISGGSSVGERDLTMDVIQSFPAHKIHFHGLSIRPGNPTIFASVESKWIFGLPGQPVSSLIVFYQFVLPFLIHLSGEKIDPASFTEKHFQSFTARLKMPVRRLKAKTDYLPLRLEHRNGEWFGIPVTGKSASLSTLALADGFSILDPGDGIVEEGALLKVFLFP